MVMSTISPDATPLQNCTALSGNTENIYTVNIALNCSTTYTPMLHARCTRQMEQDKITRGKEN